MGSELQIAHASCARSPARDRILPTPPTQAGCSYRAGSGRICRLTVTVGESSLTTSEDSFMSHRRVQSYDLCALRKLNRPMTGRVQKTEIPDHDRRQSPRMRGPAAGGDGGASAPSLFAAIVRGVGTPASFCFPPSGGTASSRASRSSREKMTVASASTDAVSLGALVVKKIPSNPGGRVPR